MREKLIELLRAVQYQGNAVHGYHDKYIQNGELADHLIANNVVPVVRCKDCIHWDEIKHGYGWCCLDKTQHKYAKEEEFCSFGERKDNG